MVDQLDRTRSQPISSREIQGLSQPKPSATPPKKMSLLDRFATLGLGTKATLLAITLGTLPVLGIGGLAYVVGDQVISNQIAKAEQSRTVGLSDKLNRYMDDRFSDLQYLAKSPTFANPKIRASLTRENKDIELTTFVQAKTMYDSVAAFDLDGNVIAQSAGPPLDNHRDRDYFKQVISAQAPIIASPERSKSTGERVIHIASPIFDSEQKNMIGVMRVRIPLDKVDEVAKNFAVNGEHYHIGDANGNLFLLSDRNETDDLGRNIGDIFPSLKPALTERKNNTLTGTDDGKTYLLSYAAFPQLGDVNLRWNTVITLDDTVAFGAQRSLLSTILFGTLISALGTGFLAAWLARKGTQPILDATRAVKALGEGKLQTRLEVEGQDELAVLGGNINQMAGQLETLVKIQSLTADRSNTMARIVGDLRVSLERNDIFQRGVDGARAFLQCDRVVIYQFHSDYKNGFIPAESLISPSWASAKSQTIEDPLTPECIERYKDGQLWSLNDISQTQLTECHNQILSNLQVKANLVAPIKVEDQLIALICAHQCSGPRTWDEEEIDLFRQLSVQIGYALDQAVLFEQTEAARKEAQKLSDEQRSQKEALQMQLLDLLSDVESASDGNLMVRADVSAGEIGIVADFFNAIIENLRTVVTQVKSSADQVNRSIGKNEAAIGQLADDALQQANETTRTLDSLELMTQSILKVASNAQTAAMVTRNAADKAEEGGEAMDATVNNISALRDTIGETAQKVKRLGEASQEISKVVSLINQIAMQTNLLAINAGIEAARAGEEAQGFAVVAEEVAELATRSAAATREIEQIVSNIQQETSEVVNAMEQGTTQVVKSSQMASEAKLSLRQVVEGSRQVDELVQAISNATVSQVDTSTQISQLMKAIALVSSRTSESSKQISTTLRETVAVAQDLQASVGTFTVN